MYVIIVLCRLYIRSTMNSVHLVLIISFRNDYYDIWTLYKVDHEQYIRYSHVVL